jgi:hypothetical protein
MSKERKNCLCTAMLYDPKDHYQPEETKEHFNDKLKVYERLMQFKQSKFLNRLKRLHSNTKLKSVFAHFFNL